MIIPASIRPAQSGESDLCRPKRKGKEEILPGLFFHPPTPFQLGWGVDDCCRGVCVGVRSFSGKFNEAVFNKLWCVTQDMKGIHPHPKQGSLSLCGLDFYI